MLIGVCLEWADLAPDVDPLRGEVRTDERTCGLSAAGEAALEWALRAGDAWGGDVLAVTFGPPSAQAALRVALAAGARHAVGIDAPDAPGGDPADPADPARTAAALASALRGCALVLCGDAGATGGSGAVPPLIARHLGAAGAFGAVELELLAGGTVRARRRLDGGRREVLDLAVTSSMPAVVSVEGAAARLRRASLQGVLGSSSASIVMRPAPDTERPGGAGAERGTAGGTATVVRRHPPRPRARQLAGPEGASALDRVGQLLGLDRAATTRRGAPEVLTPTGAADRILEALAGWGVEPRPSGDRR